MITDINQIDTNKRYTYADYLTWQFQERVELIKGKLFRMSPAPRRAHQEIESNLHYELKAYFKKKACQVYPAPFDVRLTKLKSSKLDEEIETVVQPDICVVCDKNKLDDRGCIGAPDLIVEILSTGTLDKDIKDKFELYEENDVMEYWIADPMNKTVIKYTLENGKYVGDKLRSKTENIISSAFPDLIIHLEEIFEN